MVEPKIFIATPTMRPPNAWTYNSWGYNLWQLGKVGVDILPPRTYENYPLSHARNEMVREFLESDATHLLSWDVDQVFYVDTVLRLLSSNKPVVSGFYLARNPEKVGTIVVFKRGDTEKLCDYTHFNTYKPYSPKELFTLPRVENDGMEPLVQVDGVGMGCILFQREVFENLRKPYFLEWSPVMPSDVHYFGEDLWFGDVLAEAGIPIYVNLACFVGHEVTTVLDDNYLKRQLLAVGARFS